MNPFRDHVVQDAWQSPPDVLEIHRGAFDACIEGIAAACRDQADSLLVHGSAGSGKTHLLTRLQRHLTSTAREEAADKVLRCVFVYVRLRTSPRLLWQHVRRRLANELMRKDHGMAQITRLVAHQIGLALGLPPRLAVLYTRASPEDVERHLPSVFAKLQLPRNLEVVLEHLVRERWVRDASAWLAGDSLPESVLAGLGVAADEESDREATARETVLGICKLASDTLPIVFCFDQVEALQRAADDHDAFFRFGQLAADIHDADGNVFLVTCLQTVLLPEFKAAVREADFDRLAKRETVLHSLRMEEVRRLVTARLDAAEDLGDARASKPGAPFHPLTAAQMSAVEGLAGPVPRRVLAECARQFDEAQAGEPPPRVEQPAFLARELNDRLTTITKTLEPGDTKNTLVQGAELLEELGRLRVVPRDRSEPDEIDVVLESGGARVAMSVRNEADGRSLTPRLRALVEQLPRKDGAPLVVARDPRVPISQQAVVARKHLATLQTKGAAVVEPPIEALAALATLSELLADAKSGDLANEGDTIGEGAVLDWIRALAAEKPAALAPVDQLVETIFGVTGAPGAPDVTRAALADLVSRERIVELEPACQAINAPADRLLEIARQSPDRWLVLEGPPTLFIDVAGVTLQGADEEVQP